MPVVAASSQINPAHGSKVRGLHVALVAIGLVAIFFIDFYNLTVSAASLEVLLDSISVVFFFGCAITAFGLGKIIHAAFNAVDYPVRCESFVPPDITVLNTQNEYAVELPPPLLPAQQIRACLAEPVSRLRLIVALDSTCLSASWRITPSLNPARIAPTQTGPNHWSNC